MKIERNLFHQRYQMTMTIPQLINKFDNYLFVQKQRSKHTVKNYISDINQMFFNNSVRKHGVF